MGSTSVHSPRICLSPGTVSTGGIGQYTISLANQFLKMGYQVDVLIVGREDESRLKKLPEGTSVFFFPERARYAVFKVAGYFRSKRPDLVISARNNINVLTFLGCLVSGRRRSTYLVCTFHTHLSTQRQSGTFLGRLYLLGSLHLIRFFDKAIGVSRSVARDVCELGKLGKDSVGVIYNPAWSAAQEELCDSTDSAKRLSTSGKQLISMGRLTREKDFPSLLHAFHAVCHHVDAYLWILGEGPEEERLWGLIVEYGLEGRVSMPGYVDNPYAYLKAADLFVLTSAWEGFGNVLVEALGCGLPVVATDCPGGVSEILHHGDYGKLAEVGNSDSIARLILEALDEPLDCDRQKERARAFSRERSARQYTELLGVTPSSRTG